MNRWSHPMNKKSDTIQYAVIGAEIVAKRCNAKCRKIEAILTDREIYPALSHDTRGNLGDVIGGYERERRDAETFLSRHRDAESVVV